jgi:hypothetical protein
MLPWCIVHPALLLADIPPEELVNFFAKSGKQEEVQAAEQQQKIDQRNVGHKLLSKMGWRVRPSVSVITCYAIKQVAIAQSMRCGTL